MVIAVPDAVDVKTERAMRLIIIRIANLVPLNRPVSRNGFATLHMFDTARLIGRLPEIRGLRPLILIGIIAVMGDAMKGCGQLFRCQGLIISHKIMRRQKAIRLRIYRQRTQKDKQGRKRF